MGTFGGYAARRFAVVIALIAAAILSATVGHAATQTATTQAIALKPLSIVKLRDLDFGRISAGASAGTVVIDPTTDARTTTGGALPAGGTPQAAQFYTYATAGKVLQVNRGALPVLSRSGGGATMTVTVLTLNGPVLRTVDTAGILDLRVGGTLAVGTNQLDGSYSGTFDIIVTYF